MATTDHSERDIVRDYLKAFNEQDRDTMAELLADDVVEHGTHEELHGVDEILDFLDAHFATFPDYSGSTEAMVSEGDTVSVLYIAMPVHSTVWPVGSMSRYSPEWVPLTEIGTRHTSSSNQEGRPRITTGSVKFSPKD